MNRLLIVLTAWLCSTYPLSAAIITERNDVFSSFPEPAIFRGTSVAPGIESQWIPYGTYTGGNGDTEYLRVTSNLVGVVASVFDGYWERQYIVTIGSTNILDGAEGELWTNDTQRILDYINNKRRCIHGESQAIRTNTYYYQEIELSLCPPNGTFVDNYGSRALDALAVNVDPPISTSWSAAIPFSATNVEDWVSVWPTYSAVTNDAHFLTDTNRVPLRSHVEGFLGLGDYAGQDYVDACDDLFDALNERFVPVTIPEVLAYDTGLKHPGGSPTNDYWTVNGARLSMMVDEDEPGHVQKWWWSDETFQDDYGTYEWDIAYNDGFWEYYKYYISYDWGSSPVQSFWSGYADADLDYIDGVDPQSGDSCGATRTRLYDETDDFAHWRNMTTRLDWKRLGIICQLERQMETTYYPRGSDQLPLVAEYAEVGNSYTGTLHVTYTIAQSPDPGTGAYPVTWEGSLSEVNWNLEGSSREVSTNLLGMSFPLAAAGHPSLSAVIPDTSVTLGYFDISAGDLENACANYFTSAPSELGDGNYFFSVFGTFSISGKGAALVIDGGYIMDTDADYHDEFHLDTFASWQINDGIADFSLRREEQKAAQAYYTLSDALSVRSNLVESITRNDIFFWDNGWIAERTLPTFEIMISATNCQDLVHVSFRDGVPAEMCWDDLAPSNGARRAFRLSPEPARATSCAELMINRVAILRGLDTAVKSQFTSIAGQPVTAIASPSAHFAPGDSAALRAEIGAKHPQMHLEARTFQGAQYQYGYGDDIAYIVIDGHLDITSGTAEAATIDYVYDQASVPIVTNAYRFGNWGLALGEAKAGMTATNCPPVRVDGHQSQVLKTLWRFKNLRDPNL